MNTLERIGLEILGGAFAIGAVLLWWNLHNRAEQKIGAAQCIQTTTIDHTEAKADASKTQAAQAVDINAVVQGYETKIAGLMRDNAQLARGLSARRPVCPSGVSGPGRAAGANTADAGLAAGQGESQSGPLDPLPADLEQLLGAGDAAQVKSEDCAKLYNGVRDRAIAAAAALTK